MKSNSFRDLVVWEKFMVLAQRVYGVVKLFPKDEQYGLVSQMKRAALSVPSNIAEGQRRASAKEFTQFLHIARASLAKLETQIDFSLRIGYVDDRLAKELLEQIDLISAMLHKLHVSLRTKTS